MEIPIILDVTSWPLSEVNEVAEEILIEGGRVYACVGYQWIDFEEWMRGPLVANND